LGLPVESWAKPPVAVTSTITRKEKTIRLERVFFCNISLTSAAYYIEGAYYIQRAGLKQFSYRQAFDQAQQQTLCCPIWRLADSCKDEVSVRHLDLLTSRDGGEKFSTIRVTNLEGARCRFFE
jgi:hypothetical protein